MGAPFAQPIICGKIIEIFFAQNVRRGRAASRSPNSSHFRRAHENASPIGPERGALPVSAVQKRGRGE
jgi:hypothetical protein